MGDDFLLPMNTTTTTTNNDLPSNIYYIVMRVLHKSTKIKILFLSTTFEVQWVHTPKRPSTELREHCSISVFDPHETIALRILEASPAVSPSYSSTLLLSFYTLDDLHNDARPYLDQTPVQEHNKETKNRTRKVNDGSYIHLTY